LAVITLLGATVAVLAVLGTGAASRGAAPTYEVRAIFDNAAFAVPGEDVRIAGANVGSIQSLDVCTGGQTCSAAAPPNQAAVTISIGDPRFAPFHANATCAIRPQSLIGERYVDCDPGNSSSPALSRIQSGAGKGSYLLPVTRTSSPVDSDIVQDIYQEPIRERFALILNELGTGLAARGSDLNDVIHRANPALGHTDQVLKILAKQNRDLANLASDSDAVLAPLAKVRGEIAGFVVHANTVSVASAERARDIQRSFQLFPEFLRQLRPLLVSLANLADQGTPLMASLEQSAAALGRQFQNLTPFARAARPALIELGKSSQQSQPALVASIPLAKRLNNLGKQAVPSSSSLDKLTASLNNTGAIEQLMSVLYQGVSATNAFDAFGHFVRAEPMVGQCTTYDVKPVLGCSSNFFGLGAAASAASDQATAASSPVPVSAMSAKRDRASGPHRTAADRNGRHDRRKPSASAAQTAAQGNSAQTAAQADSAQANSATTLNGLLRYLIGNGR
jgi:ABC-type transporter Mla subunit MlaD